MGGCDRRLTIGALSQKDDNGANVDGGQPNTDAGTPEGGVEGGVDGGSPDPGITECDRTGPLLAVGDGAGPSCGEAGQARAFRYVACSCDDLINSTSIVSDAFETPNLANGLVNGSIGANGAFYPQSATIGGALTVAGLDGIPTKGNLTFGGDLRDQGQLDGPFDISIDGDADVGGDVRVKSLMLTGTLRVNGSSTVAVTEGNPPITVSTVNVAAPCDCSGAPDIAALVLAAKDNNDNALVGLDPEAGLKSLDAPIELTLPCGRYYVTEFYAPKPITVTITGRVTLYVSGDLVTELGGSVRFQLAPGGELDLLIAKNVAAGDLFEVGSAATTGRARIYAGGTGTLFFAGNTTLAGTLYAPSAELVTSGTLEVFGAVLAGRMSSSGALKLHYDRRLANGTCPLAP